MQLAGTVKLQVEIEPSGVAGTTKILRGHPMLAQSAVDAVNKWRWAPAGLVRNAKVASLRTASEERLQHRTEQTCWVRSRRRTAKSTDLRRFSEINAGWALGSRYLKGVNQVWQKDVLDFINAAFLKPSSLTNLLMPIKAFFSLRP